MNESQITSQGGCADAWERVLQHLGTSVDEKEIAVWLRSAEVLDSPDGSLCVRVSNQTIRDWVEAHYRGLIEEAFNALRLPFGSLTIVVPNELSAVAAAGVSGSGSSSVVTAREVEPKTSETGNLIPSYTFSSFVVGSSNQFAHAAASRVASDPGRSYNPLFLYGGAGLGKTHLMQAIAHSLRSRFPHWRIVYLSAERFTNEMVQSLKNDSMVTFHERFRNVDALLVDDIQFLTRKERTQEEFFHTFNTLYERQTQIVLSSDRAPKEIDQIEDRLRSRFEWGLTADIQQPDLETRQAILIKKAEAQNFELPDKIALLIATCVKSNIRELEGTLLRLIAFSSFTSEPIDEAMVRQMLNEMGAGEKRKVTIDSIQRLVCEQFGLRLSELKARDNSIRVVRPRQVAMWLSREVTRASLPEIARAFGNKHHTTVLHSINKISKDRDEDKDLNKLLNKLLSQLE